MYSQNHLFAIYKKKYSAGNFRADKTKKKGGVRLRERKRVLKITRLKVNNFEQKPTSVLCFKQAGDNKADHSRMHLENSLMYANEILQI